MRIVALVSSSLLLAACSTPPSDDEANVTTMMEGESTQSDAPTSESTDESTTTAETTTDSEDEGDGDGEEGCTEPIKLDIPSDREAPMPESCTVEWIPWPTPEQYPGCEICELDGGCAFDAYLGCVTPAAGETCADICPEGDCLGVYWDSCEGDYVSGTAWGGTCGHYEIDGRCCTIGKFLEYCAE